MYVSVQLKFYFARVYCKSHIFFSYLQNTIAFMTNNTSLDFFFQFLFLKANCSLCFHCVFCFFLADVKQLNLICVVGLLMVFCGEGLRKSAMLTAGSNFNHIVQNEKAHSHVLVTSGVYSLFRHPSYVGWFYWSVGTQVSWPFLKCSNSSILLLL